MSNIQTGAERMPHDLSHLGFLAGQIGRLITISTKHQQATTNQNVKKRPACSELRWAYCNHKATYFASYLTGGDCVPDDRSEERFSRNAETDLVCRLLLEKKKNDERSCKDMMRTTSQHS